MGNTIARYEPPSTQHLTVHFGANVFGQRFCGPLTTYQDDPLALASDGLGGNLQCAGLPAAGGEVGGIVKYDVVSGKKGGVMKGAGIMVPLISGAAVASGAELQTDAAGKVITLTTGRPVGKAHSTVAGADLLVMVETYAIPSLAHG